MSYPFCCIVLTHHFDALPLIPHDENFGVFNGFKVVSPHCEDLPDILALDLLSPHFADLLKLPLIQPIKVSGSRFTVPTHFAYARLAVFHLELCAVPDHSPHY